MNGQLLWLGMQCLPQLLAPLSLLMGHTPQTTVDTGQPAAQSPRSPFSCCTQGRQLVFIVNAELLPGKESNMSLISWHLSRPRRVASSSSAAETQAAGDGGGEAVCKRSCLREVLFGQLDVQNWQSEARQVLAALLVDCRVVYDALARSSSSCLGLKDKKSGLEAFALKHSIFECGTMIRWCHSATAGRRGNIRL